MGNCSHQTGIFGYLRIVLRLQSHNHQTGGQSQQPRVLRLHCCSGPEKRRRLRRVEGHKRQLPVSVPSDSKLWIEVTNTWPVLRGSSEVPHEFDARDQGPDAYVPHLARIRDNPCPDHLTWHWRLRERL